MAKGLIVYLDTSAFLKLYVAEPESEAVRELLSRSTIACTHLITYVEMRAAVAKGVGMHRLLPERLRALIVDFEADGETLSVIDPDEAMARRAGDLSEQFDLRGYDSVHLAGAEAVYNASRGLHFEMAVYDSQLSAAAAALGVPVFGSH